MHDVKTTKVISRAAHAIHASVEEKRTCQLNVPAAPCTLWSECSRGLARLMTAVERGWQTAAKHSRVALIRRFEDLEARTREILRELEISRKSKAQSTLRDIYGDVQGLRQEFCDVKVDLAKRALSVITEPIELEGIQLGRFEIRLNWKDLAKGNQPAYRIIALEPYPAASNDECFHPHVENQVLCEGKAKQPIRLAVEHGRIFDLICLVAGTLRTYNSESAYVALADWQGVRCADCDGLVNDDDSSRCFDCESQLCDECMRTCSGCAEGHCSQCASPCISCNEDTCKSCQSSCENCCEDYCSACLDERGNCDACQQTKTDDQPANAPQDKSAIAV